MTDREKVIAAYICQNEKLPDKRCEKCQYGYEYLDQTGDNYFVWCNTERIMVDAIDLLKVQEPRVMTLEELDALGDNAIVWLECLYTVDGIKTTTLQPAIYQSENSGPEEDGYYCVVSSWSHSGFYHKDNYGGDWRCWTFCPDEKRRAETPWQQ